jgi:hypothetical protein
VIVQQRFGLKSKGSKHRDRRMLVGDHLHYDLLEAAS